MKNKKKKKKKKGKEKANDTVGIQFHHFHASSYNLTTLGPVFSKISLSILHF